ncbi:hypothetical protein E2562_032957 [Oryza meyeriana var. granulata]|uniref:Uncharacterized protein n=1 Tax=Oryza meyeriana var. granulata TaxID=110450 RepID=A0A6G1D920_9ORYZ|nr:hypothetical protein E2562_032957 [Oryza meyeriana var. granulata]
MVPATSATTVTDSIPGPRRRSSNASPWPLRAVSQPKSEKSRVRGGGARGESRAREEAIGSGNPRRETSGEWSGRVTFACACSGQ